MSTQPDTIAAISTPPGPGAIGILRLSGPGCAALTGSVFTPKQPFADAPDRRLVLGLLHDRQGRVIDECLGVVCRAPHSYTGEETVELQCHGSTAVLCAGLDALFAQGVRQAEAGEFTRRAFLNGKMGLSEAEAVHDLITARTAEAAQNAAAQVMGAVGSPVQQMRDELLGMVAHFHAVVDFPDEDIDPVLFEDAAALLDYLKIVGGETDNLSFGAEGVPLAPEEEQAYLRTQVDSPDHVQYLARVDGELIGTASLNRKPGRMRHRGVFGISLKRAWWGCGAASALTEAVLAFARENGFAQLDIEVRSDNVRAIRLYEKFGFRKLCTFPAFFRIGGQDIDFDVMLLQLPQI